MNLADVLKVAKVVEVLGPLIKDVGDYIHNPTMETPDSVQRLPAQLKSRVELERAKLRPPPPRP